MVETQMKGILIESDPRLMNGLDAVDTNCIAKLRRIQTVKFWKEKNLKPATLIFFRESLCMPSMKNKCFHSLSSLS